MTTRLLALALFCLPLAARSQGKTADPVTGEQVDKKDKAAKADEAPKGDDKKKDEKKDERAAPVVPQKLDPKTFQKALEAYFRGDQREAARLLFSYTQNVASTDENYAWAQFFLARSFIDLGLRHAGAAYLARIAQERTNPSVLPKALEELKALTDVPHDEVLIDDQVFGALDLGFLPEEVSGYAHYQQGLVDLRVGNERWANTHFAKLPEGSPEHSRARYALLVTRLKTSKKDLPKEMIDEFYQLAKDENLTQDARNDSMMAVARLRFEQKDYRGALEAYGLVKLPELDPGRASLYLEEAWTRYQMGEIHAAMGILTTLDAPSFRDEFLPDKYLLRAFIYKDLCHYLPAKRAAKELTRRYADSLEAIREREDLTEDARLKRAASSHGPAKRARKFLESLELEGERLGRYAGSFGDQLFSYTTRLYDLARAEAVRVYDARLKAATREEADRLLRAAEQVRLMEYEVGLKLYERIKKGSKLTANIEEEQLKVHQIGYRFNGEYWNDELRSYRFSLKSRCIEETAQ